MDRSSLGVQVLIFFGGFRSNISCTCAATGTVMLFKQAKLGHVISLLQIRSGFPCRSGQSPPKACKGPYYPHPPYPALWSHPPDLSHSPLTSLAFSGAREEQPHFRVFLLAVSSAWNLLPSGSTMTCFWSYFKSWVKFPVWVSASLSEISKSHLLSETCAAPTLTHLPDFFPKTATFTSSCLLPLLMVCLSLLGCEPRGGREFYSPQSPWHRKQCLAQ